MAAAPKPPTLEEEFDAIPPGARNGFFEGLEIGIDPYDRKFDDHRILSLTDDSIAGRWGEYQTIWDKQNVEPGFKGGYAVGRAARDLISNGTRRIWWYANHPDAVRHAVGDAASVGAGLSPDYLAYEQKLEAAGEGSGVQDIQRRWAHDMGFSYRTEKPQGQRFAIPYAVANATMPLLSAMAFHGTTNNHDWRNLAGGGRPLGYEAIIPSENDKTQTTNPIGEYAARYVFGRTGRLLPWDEFTQERPDVGPTDYGAYKTHQWDKGLWNMGLIKGTGRNLDGEPEFTMMGFRVPATAIGATAGSLVGGVAGANMLNAAITQRYHSRGGGENLPGMFRMQGPRRMAGAALGAAVGAAIGGVGTRAVNEVAVQPLLYPERVAEQRDWEAQQQALGLI